VIKETIWDGRILGAVLVWRAVIEGLKGVGEVVVIRPLKSSHNPRVLEIVACKKLRPLLGGGDDITVRVVCSSEPWSRVPVQAD